MSLNVIVTESVAVTVCVLLQGSCVSDALQVLPLFIPCPNQLHNIGLNRECFVPNPSATSSLNLAMYSFVGKLFAIALHKKNVLALAFPSMVWKYMVCVYAQHSPFHSHCYYHSPFHFRFHCHCHCHSHSHIHNRWMSPSSSRTSRRSISTASRSSSDSSRPKSQRPSSGTSSVT